MANDTTITITGNLTADPELRFLDSGAALARFTVAATPRTYDKTTSKWADGEPMFLTCTAWRQLAENVANSLDKGARVVVTGRLKQRHWETPEGEKRSAFGLDVDEIGPSLRFATAKVTRAARASNGTPTPDDPWTGASTAPPAGDEAPPF